MDTLILSIVLGTSIWVALDARQIGIKTGQLNGGLFDMKPWEWFLFCLMLWFVGFPYYLAKRSKYIRFSQKMANFYNSNSNKSFYYAEEIKAESRACIYCGREQCHKHNQSEVMFNLGRYEDASASYNKALEINPFFQQIWYNQGLALLKLGRYEDAIASYDKAIEIKPDYHEAWYNKSRCYALQGKIDLAIENLLQAINISPDEYRERAKTDSELNSIRADERFLALIQHNGD